MQCFLDESNWWWHTLWGWVCFFCWRLALFRKGLHGFQCNPFLNRVSVEKSVPPVLLACTFCWQTHSVGKSVSPVLLACTMLLANPFCGKECVSCAACLRNVVGKPILWERVCPLCCLLANVALWQRMCLLRLLGLCNSTMPFLLLLATHGMFACAGFPNHPCKKTEAYESFELLRFKSSHAIRFGEYVLT